MKVICGFILGFACMFFIAFDNEMSKLNHIQLNNDKFYSLDLPEEITQLTNCKYKQDILTGYISGDTLHIEYMFDKSVRLRKTCVNTP